MRTIIRIIVVVLMLGAGTYATERLCCGNPCLPPGSVCR